MIPGQGIKIPHPQEQLSPHTAAAEPQGHNQRVPALERNILHDATKILCAPTKTQHSQMNNKYISEYFLKDTEIYSLTFLEARGPKSVSLSQNQRVSKAVLLLDASGENPSSFASSSLWWLRASLGLRSCRSVLCLCSHIVSSVSNLPPPLPPSSKDPCDFI